MIYTIQNEFLTVSADDQGGELRSVFCETSGVEYLWQGDPKWWAGRAPLLFPFIGKLKDGFYKHRGKQYSCTQNHGFARRNKFISTGNSKNSLAFLLSANEATRSVYPFEFELFVVYELKGRSLFTEFKVTNKSDEDMYFSIGGHPAFNCPLLQGETFEDYEINFNEKETAGTHIITEDGLASCETLPFFNDTSQIPLKYELFNKYQTLVFSNLKSTSADLRSQRSGAGVTLDFEGFPYFGIWQPPGAPFVCLEPWQGVDDSPEASGNLCEKAGIMKLAPGMEHSCGYKITPFTAADIQAVLR